MSPSSVCEVLVSKALIADIVDQSSGSTITGDKETGQQLLAELVQQAPLRPNPRAIPSMWYMALIDAHYFFDGFGFAKYMKEFGWEAGALDEHEKEFPPERPLLPYLEGLDKNIPQRYDLERDEYVENPEWLIFEGIAEIK